MPDFGQITNAFDLASRGGETGARPIGWGQPMDFNNIVIGDVVNSQINNDMAFGSQNIFLWGHDKWGSAKNKVGE